MSRGQFIYLGAVGTGLGIVLFVPSAVYFLSPAIETVVNGKSDVPNDWKELTSVYEIPPEKPVVNLVEFKQRQTYDAGQPGAIRENDNVGTIPNAVLVSWKDGIFPSLLKGRSEKKPLSETEIKELKSKLNVMSNACAHLGCPTRWSAADKEILCPCHGGIYDINGMHIGGPPPHGLWRYTFKIQEDGTIYIKHDFYLKEQPGGATHNKPYVV